MKKLISLLLAASISFCLAACGNSASYRTIPEAGPGNDSQGDVKRITTEPPVPPGRRSYPHGCGDGRDHH